MAGSLERRVWRLVSTVFTLVNDDASNPGWPDNTTTKVSTVTGDLADQVRAKTGMAGRVQVTELGVEGGWSEMTVEWSYEVVVSVDATIVWTSDSNTPLDETDVTGPFGRLLAWVGV